MSFVADLVTEQTTKREKFKAIYQEILESELVPYLSEEITIKKYIEEQVVKEGNTLMIGFKLFWSLTNNYELSITDYIVNICFQETFIQRLLSVKGTVYMKQIKYPQYNLREINTWSFISNLINYQELATEIFKETTIPQQLIKLGNSLGFESDVSYTIDEQGISIPVWELCWQ